MIRSRKKWTDCAANVAIQPALFELAAMDTAQPKRRRPGSCKRIEPREVDITRVIIDGLRRHPAVCRIDRSNTGAGRLMQHGKPGRFIRFGFVGQSDISGVSVDGRVIAIEVKRRTTRKNLSAEQRAYLDQVKKAGGLAGVATCYAEAVAIVEGR